MQADDCVVITKDDPSVARVVTHDESFELEEKVQIKDLDYCITWEDAQRFAWKHKVHLVEDAHRSRPVKRLYTIFYETNEGVEAFEQVVWAHSMTEVILWLKKENRTWWTAFKAHLKCRVPERTDLVIDQMHPFELLDCMDVSMTDTGDELAFRIFETEEHHITDIRPQKKVKRSRSV